MKAVLIRMELGTVHAPMPDFAPAVEEFRRKAEVAGVPVKPSLKVTDTLERPEAWGAPAGTNGYVAFLGNVTSRDDAVQVLSQISVSAPATISVKFLTPAEAATFQDQARSIVEGRKTQRTAAPASGRHAAAPAPSAANAAPAEPYELTLTTPEDARRTPLDVSWAAQR